MVSAESDISLLSADSDSETLLCCTCGIPVDRTDSETGVVTLKGKLGIYILKIESDMKLITG